MSVRPSVHKSYIESLKECLISSYREDVVKSLDENGYAVLPNVLSLEECDQHIKEYKEWFTGLEESGVSLMSCQSLIQGYRIGHFKASWSVRLKVKDIFAQIWETNKLFSSVDCVAMSYPPEHSGNSSFQLFLNNY